VIVCGIIHLSSHSSLEVVMNGKFLFGRALRAIAAAACAIGTPVMAQVSGSWVSLTGGTWSGGSNWSSNPLFPDGGGTATIGVGNISIQLNPNVTLGQLTFKPGRGSIIVGTTSFTLTGAGQIGTAFAMPGPQPIIGQAGASIFPRIAGSVGLTKTGPGLLLLGGTNSYTGGTSINGGTLIIGSDGALGAAGGSVTLNGGVLATTSASSVSFLRNVLVTPAGGGFFMGASGSTFNVFSAISGTGTFSKGGNGTLVLLSDNPLSGAVRLGSGSGTLRLFSSAGALRSVPLFTLGGTLTLANTTSLSFNTNRIGDKAHLILNGGALEMLGGSSEFPVTERVGTITLGRGTNFLSSGGTLLASELVRQNRAVLRHSGTLILGAAPALVGGGGTIGTVNTSIVPWIGLVTYSSGLRPLTVFLPDIPAGSITTANVSLASGSFTPAAPSTINALGISSTSLLGTSTVTITSGVISGSGTIATPIDFGAAEGFIHAGGSMTISGPISGSNGLTISQTGSFTTGTITLSPGNIYTGTTTLNSATVLLSSSVMPGTPSPFGNDTTPIALNESSALLATTPTTFARDLIVRSDLDPSTTRFPSISGLLNVSGNIVLEGILGASNAMFSGSISGPGAIRVSGPATFSGNNAFTGGVWNPRSIVFVGSDTALGSGTAVFEPMDNSGTFGVATLTAVGGPRTLGNPFAIGNLRIAGAFPTTLTGPVQLNGGVTTLSVALATPQATISGPISDGLLHLGAGRLILVGNNSQYATNIASGTLTILNSNALGGAGGSLPLLTSVGADGALELFGGLVVPPHRLDVASGSIGVRSIVGHSTWSGDIVRTANRLRIAVDADSLTIGGTLDLANGTFEKLGAGTLIVGNLRTIGNVNVAAGTVRVRPDGTGAGASKVGVLAIAGGATPTARLALTNNSLVIDYSGPSPIDVVRAQIVSGRANNTWNGNGITGTFPDPFQRILGYGENSVLGLTTFMGQTVDATSLIVRPTFFGDSDLDGDVDVNDLGRLASHWQSSGNWTDGDFNYSGFVDAADLGVLASQWQSGVTPPIGPSLPAALAQLGLPGVAVPEPAQLALLAAMLSLRRRRPGRRR
jgi:autotransporter-associated beta strand protein